MEHLFELLSKLDHLGMCETYVGRNGYIINAFEMNRIVVRGSSIIKLLAKFISDSFIILTSFLVL